MQKIDFIRLERSLQIGGCGWVLAKLFYLIAVCALPPKEVDWSGVNLVPLFFPLALLNAGKMADREPLRTGLHGQGNARGC